MPRKVDTKDSDAMVSVGIQSFYMKRFDHAIACLGRGIEGLVRELKNEYDDSLGHLYVYYAKSLLELTREDGDTLFCNILLKTAPTSTASGSNREHNPRVNPGFIHVISSSSSDEDAVGCACVKEESSKIVDLTVDEDNTVADTKKPAPQAATSSNVDDVVIVSDDEEDDVESGEEGEDAVEAEHGCVNQANASVDDVRLAWETLELARVIFERRGPRGEMELADCMITLAECALENNNFEDAEKDLLVADAIYGKHKETDLPPITVRRHAHCSYLLAVVYVNLMKKSTARAFYQRTKDILQRYLSRLDDREAKEYIEVRQLLPELNCKIEECMSEGEEEKKVKVETVNPRRRAGDAIDINHLVKRAKIEPAGDEENGAARVDVDEEMDETDGAEAKTVVKMEKVDGNVGRKQDVSVKALRAGLTLATQDAIKVKIEKILGEVGTEQGVRVKAEKGNIATRDAFKVNIEKILGKVGTEQGVKVKTERGGIATVQGVKVEMEKVDANVAIKHDGNVEAKSAGQEIVSQDAVKVILEEILDEICAQQGVEVEPDRVDNNIASQDAEKMEGVAGNVGIEDKDKEKTESVDRTVDEAVQIENVEAENVMPDNITATDDEGH